MSKLLSVNVDAKTIKGKKKGYLTGILYLAPAETSGINVCAMATAGCKAGCLNKAGRAGIFPAIEIARIRKTRELFADRAAFMAQLSKDIHALIRKAEREDLIPCVRVNGTSDLPWLAQEMASRFPNVIHYDYTKLAGAAERMTSNYHLTFSHSESNLESCIDALDHGTSVAVVFDTRKGHVLPNEWHGYKVIDGDVSDLRFLDAPGVVVGLRAKGPAKHDCSGFVIPTSTLTQIAL